MRLKKVSEEVYVADEPIVKIGSNEIALLKNSVSTTPRGRVRICAHRDSSNILHEMVIALSRDTYIHPHKHLDKCESFHLIEGSVDVVALNDDGTIKEVIELSAPGNGGNFYYRLADPVYHTLLIRTPVVIFHETTNGPFKKGDALFASWAPDESAVDARRIYMADLVQRADAWKKKSSVL